MGIPGQQLNVRDPGIGISPETINAFIFFGTAQKGPLNTIQAFSDKGDVIDVFGQGPLPEDLAYYLAVAGGPVYGMRLTGATAGAAGAVTKTAIASSTGTVTVAGAAYDAYEVIIQIMKTGALGVAEFRYSLDDGYDYSEQLVVPSGGAYTIPNTNLTLTFVAGGGPVIFQAGDVHEFDCTAPGFTTSALGTDGIPALLTANLDVAALVLSGELASSSAGATMAAACAVHGESLFNQGRYVGMLLDSGTDSVATSITSYASVSGARLSLGYGDVDVASAKPFSGWAVPRRPFSSVLAARYGAILPSTDPARYAEGALPGVRAISHDEFRTELLDQKKFSTSRTWQGVPGFYPTNGRMMSAPGSDFQYWQHRRLMDIACDTANKAQRPFVSSAVRVNSNGTVDGGDADRWEKFVLAALKANLLDPENAEGTKGHVSAVDYKVDRTNNVSTTNTIRTRVAIRPLNYAKNIVTELSYSLTAGG